MSGLALRNPRVQRLRRLASRRAEREAERAFVVEGETLIAEAVAAGARVEAVFHTRARGGALLDRCAAAGVAVETLADGVLERVATTVSPQDALAVVGFVDRPLGALAEATLVVVCVGIGDPGNAGTLLRSAGAAGVGGVVFCDGSVDVYNPKTVRASAGSLFHVPVVVGGDAVRVLGEIGGWGLRRVGATAAEGDDYASADLRSPVAIVVGNESNGLPPPVLAELDGLVTIPMARGVESLNAGVAASILCFEAARQRRSS